MSSPRIILALYPQLLWTESSFQEELALLLEDDRIVAVDSVAAIRQLVDKRREQGQYVTSRRLAGKALIPGLVNTHSHAFQRGIRGRTEYPRKEAGQREDFWSWRGVMYDTASRLTPEDVEALALACYVEMVKAGYTRVGEFHYLHHQPDGTPYDDRNELAWRVLRGAEGAGIGLTMLRAYYRRAGVGRPQPEGAQSRFCDQTLEHYLQDLEEIRSSGCPVAVTPHSVRAVEASELQELIQYREREGLPLHIHISEQPREIEECLQEHGCRPVELLQRLGGLTPSSCLVHAIHLESHEIQAIGDQRCFIASCPTTERNLGDGIVPARALLQAGARFTFGSDSQCQIAPFEEARQLEYHLRLRDQARSVLFPDEAQAGPCLIDMLTRQGHESLGNASAGQIAPGQVSDLVALDLNHLSLAGWSPQSLALDLIFSALPDCVSDVWVGGMEVVADGYHRSQEQARLSLSRVLKKLRQ